MINDPAVIVKSELKRKGWTYKHLSHALADMGYREEAPTIASKLSRDNLSAATFVRYLTAIGVRELRLIEDGNKRSPVSK